MTSFKTPGVYIQEIDTFPPGVAAVETAIPAFMGYTERAEKDGSPLITDDNGTKVITPVRIKSMVDFEAFFGGPPKVSGITVTLTDNAAQDVNGIEVSPAFSLYHSMKLFFDNGGGDCFIAAVGTYSQGAVAIADFEAGLAAIRKVDEPTLLVAPDGGILAAAQRQSLQQKMLQQAGELKDRFAILDVFHNPNKTRFELTEVETFRQEVGASYLDYGAAYYPYVQTTYALGFDFDDIKLKKGGNDETFATLGSDAAFFTEVENVFKDLRDDSSLNEFISQPYDNGFTAPLNGQGAGNAKYQVPITQGYAAITRTNDKAELELRAQYLTEMLQHFIALNDAANFNDDGSNASKSKVSKDAKSALELHTDMVAVDGPLASLITQLSLLNGFPGDDSDNLGIAINDLNHNGVDYTGLAVDFNDADVLSQAGSVYSGAAVADQVASARPHFQQLYSDILNQILDFREQVRRRAESLEQFLIDNDPLYKRVHTAIRRRGVILPPSGGIAGLYARVDNNKGVWKAPANEGLSGVIAPTVHIDNNDQKDVNVDVNAGKSVNAIRAFRGKGILVWGGRTLKGNDDNWRYVSVRRLFIFMEESIEKAMESFVFEPNTANTWVKAQTTIENFLTTIWRDGGLAGAKAEDAFRVSVGLGKTMSSDDVNKGLMIIDVMVAPSRPAEFILLRFSQMQQVS